MTIRLPRPLPDEFRVNFQSFLWCPYTSSNWLATKCLVSLNDFQQKKAQSWQIQKLRSFIRVNMNIFMLMKKLCTYVNLVNFGYEIARDNWKVRQDVRDSGTANNDYSSNSETQLPVGFRSSVSSTSASSTSDDSRKCMMTNVADGRDPSIFENFKRFNQLPRLKIFWVVVLVLLDLYTFTTYSVLAKYYDHLDDVGFLWLRYVVKLHNMLGPAPSSCAIFFLLPMILSRICMIFRSNRASSLCLTFLDHLAQLNVGFFDGLRFMWKPSLDEEEYEKDQVNAEAAFAAWKRKDQELNLSILSMIQRLPPWHQELYKGPDKQQYWEAQTSPAVKYAILFSMKTILGSMIAIVTLLLASLYPMLYLTTVSEYESFTTRERGFLIVYAGLLSLMFASYLVNIIHFSITCQYLALMSEFMYQYITHTNEICRIRGRLRQVRPDSDSEPIDMSMQLLPHGKWAMTNKIHENPQRDRNLLTSIGRGLTYTKTTDDRRLSSKSDKNTTLSGLDSTDSRNTTGSLLAKDKLNDDYDGVIKNRVDLIITGLRVLRINHQDVSDFFACLLRCEIVPRTILVMVTMMNVIKGHGDVWGNIVYTGGALWMMYIMIFCVQRATLIESTYKNIYYPLMSLIACGPREDRYRGCLRQLVEDMKDSQHYGIELTPGVTITSTSVTFIIIGLGISVQFILKHL